MLTTERFFRTHPRCKKAFVFSMIPGIIIAIVLEGIFEGMAFIYKELIGVPAFIRKVLDE